MLDKDSSNDRPPTPLVCGHTAAAYKRQEAVSDTSEHHEGPGQDRRCPASPEMSSLPVLHVFLLLLALHVPRAQGQPIRQSRQLIKEYYVNLMSELDTILSNPTVPPQVSSWDKAGRGQGRAGRCLRTAGLMRSLSLFPHSKTWTQMRLVS